LNEERNRRRVDWRDVAGVLGVILIAGGAAMIYVPAGLIAGGTLLLAGAILASRRA